MRLYRCDRCRREAGEYKVYGWRRVSMSNVCETPGQRVIDLGAPPSQADPELCQSCVGQLQAWLASAPNMGVEA
jgi:hypothetical protein